MFNKWRPMLLSNEEVNTQDIQYPIIATIKYDGVRTEITNQGLFGRSLKRIPNEQLQEKFKPWYSKLPEGVILEGEIYNYNLPCRTIAGICNSSKKETNVDSFIIMLFDLFMLNMSWEERREKLYDYRDPDNNVFITLPTKINNDIELDELFDKVISQGHEGLVLMNPKGVYKQGRLSNLMGIGYKLKPSRTDDLLIIDVMERMENTNDSLVNELGHKYKRNTVDAKQPTGIAASLLCRLPDGSTTKVTITGDIMERKAIWDNKSDFIGKIAVVKSMDYGTKDKPRFPRLIRIKENVEND